MTLVLALQNPPNETPYGTTLSRPSPKSQPKPLGLFPFICLPSPPKNPSHPGQPIAVPRTPALPHRSLLLTRLLSPTYLSDP